MAAFHAAPIAALLLALSRADGQDVRLNARPDAMTLAPGRLGWIQVSQFVLTSPRSMERTEAGVTVSTSDSGVAYIRRDSGDHWAVEARRPGSARITIRSHLDTARAAMVDVRVREAPVGNESGLTYSAGAKLVSSSTNPNAGPSLGPMELAVAVRIRNTAAEPRDLWLSGCEAWIRVYRADKSGAPLKDIPRDAQCGADNQHVTIGPGEYREYQAGGFRLIERDTLATTRHRVVAVVDRVRDLFEVDAGLVEFPSPNAGVHLRASVGRDTANATLLHARVAITNGNRLPVRLEYGACSVTWLAYRGSSASGKPVWNGDYYNLPRGMQVACPLYLAETRVEPGMTASPGEYNARFDPKKILGDSLSPGRYYFTARVRLNYRESLLRAGSLVLTPERPD